VMTRSGRNKVRMPETADTGEWRSVPVGVQHRIDVAPIPIPMMPETVVRTTVRALGCRERCPVWVFPLPQR
jgi:hypothetical protein